MEMLSIGNPFRHFEFSIRCSKCHISPNIIAMLSKKAPADTASNAIRFGGVWLEYHERIEYAERELSTARYLCDEVTVERDLLLAEKAVLEQKFKESIASLTQTETNHLEAKQIVDKVKSEQEDLARRCLAAEAHTEWLEDQVKQLKVSKAIKDEEIGSLQFRIENLKSSVVDGETAQDAQKKSLAERDAHILSLQNLLKSRDEEILVQSRSLHSKDRQLAQLVRERNAFKDDLTDTQRALALARRSGAVHRKCDGIKNSTSVVMSAAKSTHASTICTTAEKCSLDTSTTTANTSISNSTYPATHCATQTTAHTANATTVLRKYKSSLQSRANMEGAIDSASVLLEDILLSVLTPDVNSASGTGAGGTTSDIDTSVDMCMDVVHTNATHTTTYATGDVDYTHATNTIDSTTDNTTAHILTTPIAGRKSPLTLSDAPTANLHLDEHDLDYINDILDTSADTVGKSTVGASISGGVSSVNVQDVVSDRTNVGVQKALFGTSPVPIKSSVFSHSCNSVSANPWAVKKAPTPNRTRGSASSVVKGTSTTTIANNNINTNNTKFTCPTIDVSEYLEREHNYKSALYLLQEEVRLLRSQVAGYEQAKRTVRGTPKKSSKCAAGSTAGSVGSGSSSGSGILSSTNRSNSSMMGNVQSVSSTTAGKEMQCLKMDRMCMFNQHGGGALKGKVLFA